ncbi:MAG: hypothetical protein H6512_03130 [Acidimicrobiia bacterium]|nr:hypothetical protein [Acidimicrobiia bacterium]
MLTGDRSLRGRPMRRVVDPLSSMGMSVDGRNRANNLPLVVRGGGSRALTFVRPSLRPR